MLKTAIVGVGWAGTRQAEAVKELNRGITTAALVDPDGEFLKAKSAELGVDKTYRDLKSALADPQIDAVSICSPHKFHCEQAVAAAEAGKHVLCEKPLAVTVDEATRMIEAADRNNVKLYVAENATYDPMAKFLKKEVENGEHLGELAFAFLVTGFQGQDYGYPGRRSWLSTPGAGGSGFWLLNGIHTVAQMRYVLGEAKSVYLQEHKTGSFTRDDVEGTMSGSITLESGVNVMLTQTAETRMPAGFGKYLLYGDRGMINALPDRALFYGKDLKKGEGPEELAYPEEELSAYAQELAAFVDYAENGIEGPTTGVSERRSLAIVQAGYESAKTGKAINIKERFGAL